MVNIDTFGTKLSNPLESNEDKAEEDKLRVSANQLPYQDMLLQQLEGQNYYAKVDNIEGIINSSWISNVVERQLMIKPWGVSVPIFPLWNLDEYQARMTHQVLGKVFL